VKRFLVVAAACAATCAFGAPAAFAGNGNGAPSGPHFDLNIHGVDKGQTFTGFNGNNQNDIFVPLYGKCSINLLQATTYDFQVLQSDCVSSPNTAEFQLPAPCAIDPTTGLCGTTTTVYSVWDRALAKPGGSSSTQTCAYDSTGTLVCSIGAFVSVAQRNNGKSSFTNVSSDLLFLTTCNTTTGKTVSTPLFSPNYNGYFWSYDNQGLKLLQLRFYQVPSDVPTSISC
jgi:hypothetical protein